MDSLDNQEIKPFLKRPNSLSNDIINEKIRIESEIEVAKITTCLSKEHKDCSGKYFDYTRRFFINCICSCHLIKEIKQNER